MNDTKFKVGDTVRLVGVPFNIFIVVRLEDIGVITQVTCDGYVANFTDSGLIPKLRDRDLELVYSS